MRRNVLLLQGPVGPFFNYFSKDLVAAGFNVFKINLNGGDKFFYRKAAIDYEGSPAEWEPFLETFLLNNSIGRIYLFGDCRYYHRIAKALADKHDIRLFVLEEGYIRPHFITLEESGVNGFSLTMNKDLNLKPIKNKPSMVEQHPQNVFYSVYFQAVVYYLASAFYAKKFNNYIHHRPLNVLSEGYKGVLSLVRKYKYRRSQNKVLGHLLTHYTNNYFLCPLQVHCDAQVSMHSKYSSIEDFISEVVASFSSHAESNKALVFKHHPLDRGYTNYQELISRLAREYNLQGRLYYVHDVDLPSMLQHAEGTILINSTVGMSSLFHGTPVKTLGAAIYDRPGLTFQGSLAQFWSNAGAVDKKMYAAFRRYLVNRNQINGNFYSRLKETSNQSGLLWSKGILPDHIFIADRVDSTKPPTLQVVGGKDFLQEDVMVDDLHHSENDRAYGRI